MGAALLGVVLGGCAGSQTGEPTGVETRGGGPASLAFDRELARLTEAGKLSGVALVGLPDTVFTQVYRHPEAPEPMRVGAGSRFAIGELNQVLLRAAYFRLADEGRLRLNAAVGELVPGLPQRDVINFRMLLDHRAGLPATAAPGQRLRDVELVAQPGTEERYSPLGYAVLAEALATRLAMPIERLVAEHVLRPAGMRETVVVVPADASTLPEAWAPGYTDAEGALQPVELGALAQNPLPSGLRPLPEYASTVADLFYLGQWLPASAYLRGELTQPAVRPGYRALFHARLGEADTGAPGEERVAVLLSNFGGTDLRRAGEVLRGPRRAPDAD